MGYCKFLAIAPSKEIEAKIINLIHIYNSNILIAQKLEFNYRTKINTEDNTESEESDDIKIYFEKTDFINQWFNLDKIFILKCSKIIEYNKQNIKFLKFDINSGWGTSASDFFKENNIDIFTVIYKLYNINYSKKELNKLYNLYINIDFEIIFNN